MKRLLAGVLLLPAVLSGCGSMPVYMDEAALAERQAMYTAEETGAPALPPETEAQTEPETAPETEPPTEAPTEIPPPEVIDGDVVMTNNVLVVNSGTDHARAIELYYGSEASGERFAELLNSFKGKLPEETNVYCMMIPTSAAYYVPEDRMDDYGDQQAQYENIAQHLEGVTGVPLYEALLYHRNEPIYSRTDYHWQPLGAYYAAAELAKAADVPFAPIETYERVEREGYVGAFAAVSGIDELYGAPEVFAYYKPENLDKLSCFYYDTDFTNGRSGAMFHEDNVTSSAYTIFVGTDTCVFQADTDVNNGRVLVIFKDSYGNALIPFLTSSFSTIYLCDFRYFNTDAAAFVEKVGATDVAFAMSSVACTTSVKVDMLEKTIGK